MADQSGTSWVVVRQDTHGTRFDVASFGTLEEAVAGGVAAFESGYPHHQTYFVEERD